MRLPDLGVGVGWGGDTGVPVGTRASGGVPGMSLY